MSSTTGAALAVGAITLTNDWVLTPIAEGGSINFTANWRVIPATVMFAFFATGLEKLSPILAKGVVITALVTVLLTNPSNNGKAPAENLVKILGLNNAGAKAVSVKRG